MDLTETAEAIQADIAAFVARLEEFKKQLLDRVQTFEEVENEAIRRCILKGGHWWNELKRDEIVIGLVCETCGFRPKN